MSLCPEDEESSHEFADLFRIVFVHMATLSHFGPLSPFKPVNLK